MSTGKKYQPVPDLSGDIGNKYLCAENGGGSTVVANRDSVGSWKKFTLPMNIPNPPDRLHTNEQLYQGQYLRSSNGKYILYMQHDGNLVKYGDSYSPRWVSNTFNANRFGITR